MVSNLRITLKLEMQCSQKPIKPDDSEPIYLIKTTRKDERKKEDEILIE